MRELCQVRLTLEGYEALRLADLEGLDHAAASRAMGVSRPTFGRVLAQARRSVAEAVVLGKALSIEGGHYRLSQVGQLIAGGPASATAKTEGLKDQTMVRIAVSCEGDTLDDPVDPRFGRTGGFILVDPDTMEIRYVDNGAALTGGQGAGIQAAELVARAGAKVVLTGYVGPKAFQALRASGVSVVQDLGGLSVRQAVERFLAGQAQPAQAPNRKGLRE
jgi:predicted Fe-Mo cluster-binding NifX family protein/predicted DNA-binding protein (UPF0251 family)